MGYKSPQCYAMFVSHYPHNPTDNTTFYFGNTQNSPNTTANIYSLIIPRTGIIRGVVYRTWATTAGTNENMPLVLRVNDTTDYPIATVGVSAVIRDFINYSLSIPVARGDTFEFKMLTPTWATNPLTWGGWGHVFIECE